MDTGGVFPGRFPAGANGIKERWISWCDPGVPDPDFHIPVSLGRLIITLDR
jgi:hypothetical protein